jgi:hypothetical protein
MCRLAVFGLTLNCQLSEFEINYKRLKWIILIENISGLSKFQLERKVT